MERGARPTCYLLGDGAQRPSAVGPALARRADGGWDSARDRVLSGSPCSPCLRGVIWTPQSSDRSEARLPARQTRLQHPRTKASAKTVSPYGRSSIRLTAEQAWRTIQFAAWHGSRTPKAPSCTSLGTRPSGTTRPGAIRQTMYAEMPMVSPGSVYIVLCSRNSQQERRRQDEQAKLRWEQE